MQTTQRIKTATLLMRQTDAPAMVKEAVGAPVTQYDIVGSNVCS